MNNGGGDIEFGTVYVSGKVKWLVNLYKSNDRKIRYIAVSFFVVTVALVIKFAFYNIDTVINSTGIITFDEDVYIPFKLSDEIIPHVDGFANIQFPTKDSSVNWKIQTLNLVQSRHRVVEYLINSGFSCIHLRHFGVSYDIIVFRNITMVNPVVIGESPEKVSIKEMSLDGTICRKKRSIWLKIEYVDAALTKQGIILTGDQSSCFSHYVFT
jgi:hypothetical protein